MLQRKIFTELRKWKESGNKKSLIVQGARQVGKTYAIERFGKEEYDEIVEINFKETPSAAGIFSGDLDVDTMITGLRFRFPDKKMIPGKTLIFLDEIQECEEAVTSLKFWTIDGRFDVIASGSLLGIDYKRASSYPVGYVDYIKMYGLDFEEFLWSMGITGDMIDVLHKSFVDLTPVNQAVHEKMMEYIRIYLATGGMPEVVSRYTETGDFREVHRVQSELLRGYQYDIEHYATAEEKVKAEKCYLTVARQILDKENHKFQYKEVEHGGRAQKFYSSIEWLLRADIVTLCRQVTAVCYDLEDYIKDGAFRAYTTDLSLLLAMRDFSLKQHIVENDLGGNTKGGLYECLVADILYKKGYKLYYYKNETTRRELDFIIQKDGEVIPVEVKSGKAKATSLEKIIDHNEVIKKAYKLHDGNTGIEGKIISLPLYMGIFL